MTVLKKPSLTLVLSALFSAFGINKSHAVAITFQSVDLADTVVGQDLRQAVLNVTDGVFSQNQGFTVYLPADLFSNFADPATANPGWDLLTAEPFLTEDGLFDALSLTALADTSAPFTFNFVYSGTGTPTGVYRFETYDFDPFTVTGEGMTTLGVASVPENASTGLLLGASAFGLLALSRNRISVRSFRSVS